MCIGWTWRQRTDHRGEDQACASAASGAIQNHEIHKRYVALLSSPCGKVGRARHHLAALAYRHHGPATTDGGLRHGKAAITEYEILEIKDRKTLIALYPKTGRTHQLRVHCAHEDGLSTPIVGDELYGKKADRLYLHAEGNRICAPDNRKKMAFKYPHERG